MTYQDLLKENPSAVALPPQARFSPSAAVTLFAVSNRTLTITSGTTGERGGAISPCTGPITPPSGSVSLWGRVSLRWRVSAVTNCSARLPA